MYSVNKTPQRASTNEAQTRNGTRTAASGSTGASSTKSSAARTSKRKAEAEERTRDRVLREVLNNGPVSAATLGELLSLTTPSNPTTSLRSRPSKSTAPELDDPPAAT